MVVPETKLRPKKYKDFLLSLDDTLNSQLDVYSTGSYEKNAVIAEFNGIKDLKSIEFTRDQTYMIVRDSTNNLYKIRLSNQREPEELRGILYMLNIETSDGPQYIIVQTDGSIKMMNPKDLSITKTILKQNGPFKNIILMKHYKLHDRPGEFLFIVVADKINQKYALYEVDMIAFECEFIESYDMDE